MRKRTNLDDVVVVVVQHPVHKVHHVRVAIVKIGHRPEYSAQSEEKVIVNFAVDVQCTKRAK